MKEKKTITIIIIAVIVILIVLIAVFFVFFNDSSTTEENTSTENNSPITTQEIEEENAKRAEELDTQFAEIAEADPIYKYMQGTSYETDTYKLIIGIDENNKTYLIILLTISEPKTEIARVDAEIYKEQALQQIRDWGIDPNNYQINVEYRY